METMNSDWGLARLVTVHEKYDYCDCRYCEGHSVKVPLPKEEWYWRYCGPIEMIHHLYCLEAEEKKLFEFFNDREEALKKYKWGQ